ncbi:PREDICTED: DET1- and DDB1-associated protein 1 isoform X3 [Chinchilla lanigera]|uniref:DET1- and DDB1-associated protein 1 isoform X3 n=1 Tax=Chinchilla lanigera TaxID=34839 RepID=UPI000696A1B6|nr:PREDICTED: DET1- and DDB1-associated protein 1 isoform X3 [Chinchilla lanigera]
MLTLCARLRHCDRKDKHPSTLPTSAMGQKECCQEEGPGAGGAGGRELSAAPQGGADGQPRHARGHLGRRPPRVGERGGAVPCPAPADSPQPAAATSGLQARRSGCPPRPSLRPEDRLSPERQRGSRHTARQSAWEGTLPETVTPLRVPPVGAAGRGAASWPGCTAPAHPPQGALKVAVALGAWLGRWGW